MVNSHASEMLVARNNILRATQQVLASKKVSGTRMRQIAHSAGISQGTLHYYFPSKTGLFLAVLDDMQQFFEMRQKELLSHDLDAAEKIWLFVEQQRRLLQEQPQMEEIFLDFWGHAMINADIREKTLSMYTAWRHDIEIAIQEGVHAGDFNPQQARLAPYLFVALLEGIALQYLPDKKRFDLVEIYTAANQMMLHWLECASAGAGGSPGAASTARKPYPSDLSFEQQQQIIPLLNPAKPGGRPRAVELSEVVNALLYLAVSDCSWRMLPHDFPGWQTVYAYYRQWSKDGTLQKISDILGIDLSKKGVNL